VMLYIGLTLALWATVLYVRRGIAETRAGRSADTH
jgi:hypothetical protein